MKIFKYFVIISFVALIAIFFTVRSHTVQNILIKLDFDRQINKPNPLPAEDALTAVLCGSRGPLPAAYVAETCILIKAGKKVFIVDAGDGSVSNLRNWRIDLGDVNAFLLTHTHSDHYSDLADLHLNGWVIQNRQKKLKVYGPEGTKSITSGFEKAYQLDYKWRNEHHGDEVAPLDVAGFDTHIIDLNSSVIIEEDGLKVTAFLVQHDPVTPSVGYRFDYKGRSITISGDTSYSENLIKHAMNTDVLFHEALSNVMNTAAANIANDNPATKGIGTILTDVLDYHTAPAQAAKAANLANAKRLIFYHLIPYPDGLIAKMIFLRGVDKVRDEWTLGKDGTMVILPANSSEINLTTIE